MSQAPCNIDVGPHPAAAAPPRRPWWRFGEVPAGGQRIGVEAELIRFLYRNAPTGLAVNVILMLLMSWVLWDRVPHAHLIYWFGALLLVVGVLGVDSEPGKGSTFWVELARSEPSADGVHSGVDVVGPDAAVAGGGPTDTVATILYVEDSPASRDLLGQIIESQTAYRLLTAHEAGKGLELAAAERPDLILLDINLPGMDGYRMLERLKAQPGTRDIPVFAVSANAMAGDIERGKAAGFATYFTKPVDVKALLDAIAKAVGEGCHAA